jgi:hypothetical protein
MPIPSVNLTVQDGALNSVPANVSKVCVKMGICSGAIASVAAAAFVSSTTSPDGVQFTAKTVGAQGNLINITYTTGSATEAPVISVSGNSITVQIKVGTTLNSDIVTAIGANAQANALVGAVATGPSDVAVATTQVYLSMGTLFAPSATPGDGVQFSAKTAAGASIHITTGGSVEAPVVSVVGTAITIQIKSGTTLNSDVVTGVQGSGPANALVGVVATGATDQAAALSVTSLTSGTLGVSGTINTMIPETNPTQAVSDLGYGPLTEAVCHALDVAGGVVYAMPLNPSNAGTASAVSQAGSGPAVTVAGTPNDAYQMQVKVVLGGALGVGQFQFSQDGGQTFSATFLIPSGGSFAVPNTGLTLTFASGTYVLGTLYTFSCTASSYTVTDVQNGWAAMIASGIPFGFVHLVGTASSVANSAAMAAALEVLALSAASVSFIYTHVDMECAQDTDANIAAAFASTVCTRVDVCAGFETLSSSIPGSGDITRNIGISVAAREALVPEQNDLGRVLDGPLPGVLSILRNEANSPGLDALNFTTARNLKGKTGFFITTGHMLESPGSDFALSQNRRVMDLACTIAYPATLQFLNDTLRVNNNGTIADSQATTIENQVEGQLASGVVAPGSAVATSVVIDRTNNVLATKNVNEIVRILPNGYSKTISMSIGFQNPNLAP